MPYTIKYGTQDITTIYAIPPALSAWVRPSDWLPMPATSSQEFVGLYAVNSGSNFVALSATTSPTTGYWVEWGYGNSASYASGVTAEYSHSYNLMPSESYSTQGYRQAIVHVYPSGSANLTNINLQRKHSRAGLPSVPIVNWLDIAIGGNNITSLSIGGSTVTLSNVERVNLSGASTGNMASFSTFFVDCVSLQSVPLFNTSNGTNFSSMFNNCKSLQSIPLLNTSKGTNFSSMLSSCNSLQSIPLLNTSKGTNFSSMFQSSISLQSIPLLDTISGSNFTNIFSGCTSLQTIPFINISNGTSIGGMFSSCASLQSIPLLDTSKGTSFNSMFSSCASLQTIPLLNTSNVTDFANMFQSCTSLQSVPLFNTSKGTSFNSMFQSCTSLQSVPLFNTSKGTSFNSMFLACTSLQTIPLLDVSKATAAGSLSNMFLSAGGLQIASLYNTSSSIDYSSKTLDRNALMDIFSYLSPTGSIKCSITCSLNHGVVDLSQAEITSSVLNKGWTIKL